MFDDFQKSNGRDARRRFGGSMAVAVLLCGGTSFVVVAATATARIATEEKLKQVEFAPPPEPEPQPEPEPVAAPPPVEKKARPKVKRQDMAPPDELPDEKPKESDAPLAAAEAPGPLDGFTDGVENGTGSARAAPAPPPPPPPPPPPEPIKKPKEISGNRQPAYPKAAARQGLEGTVVVEFTVQPDGKCTNPKILSGPSAFHDAVMEIVSSWRWEPATQGGKKVPFRTTHKITFRLEDA